MPLKRLLIVKTSSMGDVIHNFPVVSDLRRAFPDMVIDWVVEEGFADLPRLHPDVARVIPVALRRWRKSWFSAATRKERANFRASLCAEAYDYVLDTQGLLKSALIARRARLTAGGLRLGFGRESAREPIASLFYQRRCNIDMSLHAIERGRALAAAALGYELEGLPQFNLRVAPSHFSWLPAGPYVVLLHATSRAEKEWPSDCWQGLIAQLAAAGMTPVLVWGSVKEGETAQRLAAGCAAARVAPRITLAQAAALLAGARGAVGVDTGLTHLSAALNVRTVALFGATPRWRFAPYWSPLALSLGENGVQAPLPAVTIALQQLGVLA